MIYMETLRLACESGNCEIVKRILALNNIDINSHEIFLIIFMTFENKYLFIKLIDIFLRNINNINKALLHIAVEKENTEIVKLLLNNPQIDVNIKYIFNYLFLFNSNSNFLITFKSTSFNSIQIQII